MSANEVKTPLREVRFRIIMCCAVAFLALDAINPVKVICEILGVSTFWVALFALIYIGVVSYSNATELVYFMVKVFFHSLLSIFFSSVEVLGKQNIPEHGPVIFTGNHMNQFVDAAVMLVTTPRQMGFLVAAVSFKKRIIGDFARAAGGIPVSRPQDMAKKGVGRVMITVSDGTPKLLGCDGTTFTAWKKGDKFRLGRSPNPFRLKEVESDTAAIIAEDLGEPSPKDEVLDTWQAYDVMSAVDQSKMFDAVQSELAKGKCLGIFPEGGSHDRTDLLPLKVGVAAIAFGVLDKYDRNVPIVPVGLNYFRGHRFRGRVVVEFGEPIPIDKATISVYKQSKRAGYQKLLSQVEEGMRSVIVTAPDYNELKLLHTVRRVYQKTPTAMMPNNPTKYRQDLARRFSVGYQLLKQKYGDEEHLPQDILDIKARFEAYQDTIEKWGLRDYQVTQLDVPFNTSLYTFIHALLVITLASLPTVVLNAPVGLAASYWASAEAKKDLKASRVKLAARDVLMSKKILFSLVAVPALWVTYAVLLMLFTSLEYRTILVLFLLCPYFSYVGVTGLGMGMVDIKDLRPAALRLLPSFKDVVKTLPATRAALQRDVRLLMKKYGPELGPVYYDSSDNWDKTVRLAAAAGGASSSEDAAGGEDSAAGADTVAAENRLEKKDSGRPRTGDDDGDGKISDGGSGADDEEGKKGANGNYYFAAGVSAEMPRDDDDGQEADAFVPRTHSVCSTASSSAGHEEDNADASADAGCKKNN